MCMYMHVHVHLQCTCTCKCTQIYDIFYTIHHIEFGSEAFDEFLEVLGSKVKMREFSKYRAQLDNKSKECTYMYIHVYTSLIYIVNCCYG